VSPLRRLPIPRRFPGLLAEGGVLPAAAGTVTVCIVGSIVLRLPDDGGSG